MLAGRPLRLRLPNTSMDRANFVAVQLTLRLPDEATLVFTGSLGEAACILTNFSDEAITHHCQHGTRRSAKCTPSWTLQSAGSHDATESS